MQRRESRWLKSLIGSCRKNGRGSKMIVAHKIKLNPNAKQEKYFIQACNAARVVWNWALAEWQPQYKAAEKRSASKLDKQFNVIKYEQYSWV